VAITLGAKPAPASTNRSLNSANRSNTRATEFDRTSTRIYRRRKNASGERHQNNRKAYVPKRLFLKQRLVGRLLNFQERRFASSPFERSSATSGDNASVPLRRVQVNAHHRRRTRKNAAPRIIRRSKSESACGRFQLSSVRRIAMLIVDSISRYPVPANPAHTVRLPLPLLRSCPPT